MPSAKFDIVFDAEGNNLNPFCDTIHVVCLKAVGRERMYTIHTPEELRKLIPYAENVIGHNTLSYDLWAFSRVWDIPFCVDPAGKDTWDGHAVRFVDTLHLSQFLNPDRVGGHSVEAWAERLTGVPAKVQNDDWSVLTQNMIERCRSDVLIQEGIYVSLMKEMQELYGE